MQPKKKKVIITAILGSIRPNNFTGKALRLVIDELEKHDDVKIFLIDPAKTKFPLKENVAKALQKKAAESSGVVLATPEYHGSYSSVIKSIIENLGYPSVMAGKPVVLLGVASGQIGAVKALEHLQGVCLHCGVIVLPGAVSVASVHQRFDEKGKCLDGYLEQRIRGLAQNLLAYIHKHICLDAACDETAHEVA